MALLDRAIQCARVGAREEVIGGADAPPLDGPHLRAMTTIT